MTGLIAIDWGTTSFRAWRMDADGGVKDTVSRGPGILAAADQPGGFAGALRAAIGAWLDGTPIIASGMITSRNGWVETPYLPLPLTAADLAGALVCRQTDDGPIHFVTGAIRNAPGLAPDVMRGEETEIIGQLAAGGGDGTYLLPGTHSKWATITGGRLTDFQTVMTGEVFATLSQHSILGRLMQSGQSSADAFAQGLLAGGAPGPLAARVFSARTLALTGQMAETDISDYLSGLLIGDEVAQMAATLSDTPVTIIGRGDLADRYARALDGIGASSVVAAPGMAGRGLYEIARRAGIIA
ncbi:MAG: 2-dehydro-3-deoxygalactonokinase [Paracoccus denitrificans]|nr:MAG: 2-dehydro-3-deoxygalactonokinase [Paracoccus denitrificans]PZO86319.1 MAG: 2-dehydro-3-deoxygalactonokinase [Paracoccus denitrificans]